MPSLGFMRFGSRCYMSLYDVPAFEIKFIDSIQLPYRPDFKRKHPWSWPCSRDCVACDQLFVWSMVITWKTHRHIICIAQVHRSDRQEIGFGGFSLCKHTVAQGIFFFKLEYCIKWTKHNRAKYRNRFFCTNTIWQKMAISDILSLLGRFAAIF